jgi:myo-inositol-1(or 4)-monophosphatase
VTATPVPVPDDLPLADLEALAVEVALEAGALIVDERPERLGVSRTKSSATDVVTVMDQRAQDLLWERLSAARPDDGFLGEEEGGGSGSSGVTWVVDPIDGTVNYLYELPAYAVSVAAVVGDPRVPGAWTTVAGAVVDPVHGRHYRAHRGGGAWLVEPGREARRVTTGTTADLGHALVGTGFGYEPDTRLWQSRVLVEVITHIRDVRRIGSAALDLCAVAEGRLDAFFERGLNPWDLAGAAVVLTEAGGVVSGIDGEPPSPSMVVAGPPALHAALAERVSAAVRAVGD